MTIRHAGAELFRTFTSPQTPMGVLAVILFSLAAVFSFLPTGEQQFSYLAQSFLNGKLYFLEQPGTWADTSLYGGKYYWPLGPFPAVLLMPFVLIAQGLGIFFYQGYLLFFITCAVFFVWYCVGRTLSFSLRDAFLLALTFVFGSGYILLAMVPWSWFFAQAVAVLGMSCALYEYLTKRRTWLIGVLMAGVAMTRITAGVGALFFLLDILFLSQKSWAERRRDLLALCVPLALSAVILGLYNFARFGDIFNQGYALQYLMNESIARAREYGMVAFAHLSGNLYYFFLATPLPIFRDAVSHVLAFPFVRPDPWGMSILVTSPYLLYLFFRYKKSWSAFFLIISSIAIAVPLFLYYGIGYWQYGYRYAFDFFPFLFLLFLMFLSGCGRISLPVRVVLAGSIGINLYLFFVFYVFRAQ